MWPDQTEVSKNNLREEVLGDQVAGEDRLEDLSKNWINLTNKRFKKVSSIDLKSLLYGLFETFKALSPRFNSIFADFQGFSAVTRW